MSQAPDQQRRRFVQSALAASLGSGLARPPALAPLAWGGLGVVGLGLGGCRQAEPLATPSPWTAHWQAYRDHFISDDGRVIDFSANDISTSEGQSYAMFFAVVADDRTLFERLLGWTIDNLAAGDLTVRLPAWTWGQRDDGSWGVIDHNSASDSDLWIAYALIEAADRWGVDRYRALGRALAQRVLHTSTWTYAGQTFLLPAPDGFGPGRLDAEHLDPDEPYIVLNPSYSPIFLLDRLARAVPDDRWTALIDSHLMTLREAAPRGFAPDWLAWHPERGLATPPQGTIGSYDAIRTYLWAGLTHPARRDALDLLEPLSGMLAHLESQPYPPERVDTLSGAFERDGPIGFSAAVLPYLVALDRGEIIDRQTDRLVAQSRDDDLFGHPPQYYDQNLLLFGRLTDVGGFTEDGAWSPA